MLALIIIYFIYIVATGWISVKMNDHNINSQPRNTESQPTELCTIFQKNHVLFRVVMYATTRSQKSAFSDLKDAFLWCLKNIFQGQPH